jgi:ribosome biogenesis protein Nip4
LKRLISKDFFYAGTYLGKTKRGKFFPSFNLLRMITRKKANKVIVDKKTEWLFICGRDIFKKGMTEVTGLKRKGDYTLIVNQHGECLGFGKMLCNLDKAKDAVVVENISDIGDFLRREKKQA